MKSILLLVATLLLTMCPAAIPQEQPLPFIAIYVDSDDSAEIEQLQKLKPDLIQEAETWPDFTTFLQEVRNKAGNRPIVLDINIHGTDYLSVHNGFDLVTSTRTYRMILIHYATLGYLINQIEKELGGRNVTVLLECCYAESVYRSIRNNPLYITDREVLIQNTSHTPQFPIWALNTNTQNLGGFILLQYILNAHVMMEDLRVLEDKPIQLHTRREELKIDRQVLSTYKFLFYSYLQKH